MLGKDAVENPLKAVGGDALVFSPSGNDDAWDRRRLASATPQELTAYYAPVFVQQRASTTLRPYPYPPEFDQVGEARLRPSPAASSRPSWPARPGSMPSSRHARLLATTMSSLPTPPGIPATPAPGRSTWRRLASIAVSCALPSAPIGRLFSSRRSGRAAASTRSSSNAGSRTCRTKAFKLPMHDKKFAVDRILGPDSIDWEVAGVVDEPREAPRRPVVFIKAGDHKVIGMGSEARLNLPPGADIRKYTLAEYADLYALAVDGSTEHGPFFDLGEAGEPAPPGASSASF